MSEFYDIDSTKATFKEFWDEANVLAIVGMIAKWLRLRTPASTDDANAESTLPFVVDFLPAEALAQMQPLLAQLEALGFSNPVCHYMHDPGTDTMRYWATLVHSNGLHLARVQMRQWQRTANVKRKPFITFITGFANGEFLTTTSGKPDLAEPTAINYLRKTGWTVERLWSLHDQRVGERAGQDVLLTQTREEVLDLIERHHVVSRDFQLARGLFCPRSEPNRVKAAAYHAQVAAAQAGGLDHAEIVVELNKLQEQKPGWAGAIWILVGSAVLFLAAGAAQWDWKFTLWLIPVIFFHEAGHWLAMRIFKYKNLRMFFIPFFGAAVTGQNWNVPGWKKVIVSLAGPLPGIAVGCVLTIFALVTQKPWLNQLATILLLLNGFNLLPMLPLDGGHVLQAVLFCRNRWLDGVFRILAVLGLIGLWMIGFGRLLIYLAIPMARFLPIAFKLAKVTDALRNAPLPPPVPGEDRIPTATAQTIISAIKSEIPKGPNNKTIATYTLNVFETLNARPPGVIASIALLMLHAGSFLLAGLFGLLLTLNQHGGGIRDFFTTAIRQPPSAFECGRTTFSAGPLAPPGHPTNRNLIVSTFANHQSAKLAYDQVTSELPSSARATWFGESVLVALPASDDDAREAWFESMQARATNTFVTVSNQPVSLRLFFIAPDAATATNLHRSLEEFVLANAGKRLIPPWTREAAAPDFAKFTQARRDWARIQKTANQWDAPALKELNKKYRAAIKRGALSEALKISAEQGKLAERLQAEALAHLRTDATNRVSPALLDLHEELERLDYTNRVERLALLRRVAGQLGEIPHIDGVPNPPADAAGARGGMVAAHGLLIEIAWLPLNDPTTSLPLIADWLCRAKCTTFKYELEAGYALEGFDELEADTE
jgi:Zn-dependent protease